MGFTVDRAVDRLASLLLPPRCVLCRGRARSRGLDLCPACTAGLPPPPGCCLRCGLAWHRPATVCPGCRPGPVPLDCWHAAFAYGFPVDGLIQALKYGGRLGHARLLGTLLGHSVVAAGLHTTVEAVVPVPLHPGRLAERGFNQSLEIARWTARHVGRPMAPRALTRVRATRPQVGLSLAERTGNLQGAFAVGADLVGRHVVLVDDVVTTGSTVREAALALRRAGARRVDVWCVARTPLASR
jgi:ComF family protein